MRLNKKKLAALAMSAVMAASTMPFPVLAEEFTDGEAVAVEAFDAENSTSTGKPDITITWACTKDANGEYKPTASYSGTPAPVPADITEIIPADCLNPETVKLSIRINGYTYEGETTVGEALGHDYSSKTEDREVKENATCVKKGKVQVYEVCDRCGYKNPLKEETIPQLSHKLSGDPVITLTPASDSNGVCNVEIVNGVPTLKDPSSDGYYTKKVEQYCENEEKLVTVSEKTEKITADQVNFFKVRKGSVKGIKSGLDMYYNSLSDIKLSSIELVDCSEPGEFIIDALDREGHVKYEKTITVPAHHMVVKDIETASAEDKALLTPVKTDSNGNFVIKNNSCSKDVTYYVVEYCKASGCNLTKSASSKYYSCLKNFTIDPSWKEVSRTPVIAKPEGEHSIDNAAKAEIAEEVKAGNGAIAYAKLQEIAKKYDQDKHTYVKVSENTATCTEKGNVTVSFICHTCNKPVETINVTTKALGHNFVTTIDEATVVESTCEARGHYEVASLCTHCGKQNPENTTRTTVYTKRLKHTNETDVLNSGYGVCDYETDKTAYIKFFGDKVIDFKGSYLTAFAEGDKEYSPRETTDGIYAEAYTKCSVCGGNEVKLNRRSDMSIAITSIQKESASGVAGRITLKATFTNQDKKVVSNEITVPYYSSLIAYLGRTETEELNGLNQDKDGVTRYYEDGKFVEISGIVKYAGREYLVNKGILCEDVHGVTPVGDTFYFLANGCVQRGYTGVTIYDGQSFYLNNGVVDTDINGLVPYNGGTFLFAAGRLVKEHNGLWQDFDGSWYFLALGQVQTQYTGVAEYDGAYFYVKNGKLDTTKNGTITVDGVKYTAVNGQLYK